MQTTFFQRWTPLPKRSVLTWALAGLLATLATLSLAPQAAAQPIDNLVYAVGTTTQDGTGKTWSYVLLGSPQAQTLTGRRFDVWSHPGAADAPGGFTLKKTIGPAADTTAAQALLAAGASLGDNLTTLDQALTVLLHNVPGISNAAPAAKVITALQVAASDPGTFQALMLIARVHAGMALCLGHAFAEPITTETTYEMREAGTPTVAGRVTVAPGAAVVLPAPGFPFQVTTNAPSDHLLIRLRWGTSPEFRRLSLLSYGFDVWRVPKADSEAAGIGTNSPTLNQLHGLPTAVEVNLGPVMATKDFTTGHGTGAADDPADPVTAFFTDANGRPYGTVSSTNASTPPGYLRQPFADGESFYYYVMARDILGREGKVSPGGLATACWQLPPPAPVGVRIANETRAVSAGGGIFTNLAFLRVSWPQDTNTADHVSEYWVYRWLDPSMALTNDTAPLDNRIHVVQHAAGSLTNSYADNSADAPLTPGPSNYWYTVRAVRIGACGQVLLSPHSGPAWGVLRDRSSPDATTGAVVGSCGTPRVIGIGEGPITNEPPSNIGWNYRFACFRREPGIAWAAFTVTNQLGGSQVIGPVYFGPDDVQVQMDYSLPLLDTNSVASVTCIVGTHEGAVSDPVTWPVPPSPSPRGRYEVAFNSGELLLTALNLADPLFGAVFRQGSDCVPAYDVKVDPSGMVRMRFDFPSGQPVMVQASVDAGVFARGWVDIAVVSPDAKGNYWVYYPACLIGPLPQFQGCPVNLPGEGDCDRHVPRAGGTGPVAPIRIRFVLTPGTHEYRVYRRVDDGPLTLMAQAGAIYDPSDPTKIIEVDDTVMPPGAARLCYFVQLLDVNGNGSPLALIGCKEIAPPRPPRPVLAAPAPAGSLTNPQVSLNWFCPTTGVHRFQVLLQRTDHPNSPTGVTSPNLKPYPGFIPLVFYAGLFSDSGITVSFDDLELTPPIGPAFEPGPQFTLTATVLPNVPYHIAVTALDAQGHAGDPSQAWNFTWTPPVTLPTVPWPARSLPTVKPFDNSFPVGFMPPFLPRVQAVLLYDGNNTLDYANPVGIRIGDLGSLAQFTPTVGTTNLVTFSVIPKLWTASTPIDTDPDKFIFHRASPDPAQSGQLLLPIVVYRQQVANTNYPKVSGNLVQVTPLIDRLPYGVVNCPTCPEYYAQVTIYDRLIAAGYEINPKDGPSGQFLYLRDQQPVILGASYRYFVVRLNDQREISEVIPAGTVDLPPP